MKLLFLFLISMGTFHNLAHADVANARTTLEVCIAKKVAALQMAYDLTEDRNDYILKKDLTSTLTIDDYVFSHLWDNHKADLDCLNAVKNELK